MPISRNSAAHVFLFTVALFVSGCGSGAGDAPVTGQAGDSDAASEGAAATQAKEVRDNLHPEVVLETSAGPITLKLNAEKAPLTVRNFLHYVNSGHYDQTIFHQVDPNGLVLGGGYTAELSEKRARMPIRNEAHNGLKNMRGTIAMARYPDQVDSATSQFMINLSDNPGLDHKSKPASEGEASAPEDYGYCVFGEVVSGLDVVEKISQSQAQDRGDFQKVPVTPVAIRSAKRLR